jgi:hypothetical protein
VSVENNYGKPKATTQRKDNNYGDKSDKPTSMGQVLITHKGLSAMTEPSALGVESVQLSAMTPQIIRKVD